MEFIEMWDHGNGVKQYQLQGLSDFWFIFPSLSNESSTESKVSYIRNDELISYSAPSLKDAENKYRKYLLSTDQFKPKQSEHGGYRIGAGRKKKPTKPVRLSIDEQVLIRELRTANIDQHELIKKLIKFMAVCELQQLRQENKSDIKSSSCG